MPSLLFMLTLRINQVIPTFEHDWGFHLNWPLGFRHSEIMLDRKTKLGGTDPNSLKSSTAPCSLIANVLWKQRVRNNMYDWRITFIWVVDINCNKSFHDCAMKNSLLEHVCCWPLWVLEVWSNTDLPLPAVSDCQYSLWESVNLYCVRPDLKRPCSKTLTVFISVTVCRHLSVWIPVCWGHSGLYVGTWRGKV